MWRYVSYGSSRYSSNTRRHATDKLRTKQDENEERTRVTKHAKHKESSQDAHTESHDAGKEDK